MRSLIERKCLNNDAPRLVAGRRRLGGCGGVRRVWRRRSRRERAQPGAPLHEQERSVDSSFSFSLTHPRPRATSSGASSSAWTHQSEAAEVDGSTQRHVRNVDCFLPPSSCERQHQVRDSCERCFLAVLVNNRAAGPGRESSRCWSGNQQAWRSRRDRWICRA